MNNTITLTAPATANANRWMIIVTVMMLAILEVLDSTIVNVALPAMMSSLGASQGEITWVLTSYVVASAIVLPLTGFLSNVIGRKNFLFICAAGFMLSSLFCGISNSLVEMVIFRIIQGACGSSLIPISQTLLRETFPIEEQGKAMAIWGLGILAAPVFGPTLGGFITEHTTWRWVFYINLPFCALSLFMIGWVIPKVQAIKQKIDVLGLILMIIGIASLQIMLDKGNDEGWFQSNYILTLAATATFCLTYLIVRCLKSTSPIIQLKLYTNRNFMLCSLMMLLFCGTIFSFITLQPIMLENYFGYSAIAAGMAMAPLGIASATGMLIASRLMYKVKVKYILMTALMIASIGMWHQCHASLNASTSYFIVSNCLIGLGMGFFFVPLSTYVFATLNNKDIGEASGLFSYARMLGTSIGVSLITTLASQVTQISWHDLTAHITSFNPNVTAWLNAQNLTSMNATAVMRLSNAVATQSGILGFLAAFKTLAIILLLQIPIALSLKSVKLSSEKAIHADH